jgi:hypothetical protein
MQNNLKIPFTLLIVPLFLLFPGCRQQNKKIVELEKRIDQLEKQAQEVYKPGLGTLMANMQTHHAKLWFAGKNENWPLARFEMHELEEGLADIRNFCSNRPEIKSMDLIKPGMDSVKAAIEKKAPAQFASSYLLLTNNCNNCHKVTDHGFNLVKIPAATGYDNQEFKPQQ